MSDIFLSYCDVDPDRRLAQQIHATLSAQRVDVFMAAISLQPGDRWSTEIRNAMEQAARVIFLASDRACQSPYVQQELGAAHFSNKRIIPFIWDMDVGSLPGFVGQYQAVDLSKGSGVLMETLQRISRDIATERRNSIIALAAIAALLWYTSRGS